MAFPSNVTSEAEALFGFSDRCKEMEPSLRTLCLIALLAKEKTLEGSDLEKIPDSILREIRNLSEPNDISKPDNFPERHMG